MLQAVHYCGLTAAIQPDDYDPALVATEKSRTKRQQERRHDREQKLILQSPLLYLIHVLHSILRYVGFQPSHY